MPTNPFDRTSRYLARRGGALLLAWLLRVGLAALRPAHAFGHVIPQPREPSEVRHLRRVHADSPHRR
jgi:hypothetical protein